MQPRSVILRDDDLIRRLAHQALTYRSRGAAHFRIRRHLEQAQWMSSPESRQVRDEWLDALLRHAALHVPFYDRLLRDASVVTASGDVDLSAFTRIPLLDRTIIRANFEDLTATDGDVREWSFNSTGGSTGEPLRFILDLDARRWAESIKELRESWVGVRPGDRKAMLWGSERDLFVGQETRRLRFRRWLQNELWLNAFRMTPERMRDYVDQLNAFRPASLLGYADNVHELARFAEAERLTVHTPRAIMTGAGTLRPAMRDDIERVFGVPVTNRYGSREFGTIASQCERHGGLHISPHIHLEVLRPNGTAADPGESGEVVITSLMNLTMPLVRYRIGDIAALSAEPCPCGRGWPLLDRVEGRVTDVFHRRDGGVVTPQFLIHLVGVVLHVDEIRRFQIVQEDYDRVRVRLVTRDVAPADVSRVVPLEDVSRRIRQVMGPECDVQFDFPATIEPSPTGKYQPVRSELTRK